MTDVVLTCYVVHADREETASIHQNAFRHLNILHSLQFCVLPCAESHTPHTVRVLTLPSPL
jgi:hypothetical protein